MSRRNTEDVPIEEVLPTESAQLKLKNLSDLFNLLGPDPEQNIRIIVQQAALLLKSRHSLYNRLNTNQTEVIAWAGFDLPPDFPRSISRNGLICLEITTKSLNQVIALPDLDLTQWRTDPLVSRYGLRAYMGCAVTCGKQVVGSLCVLDTRPRQFDETDMHVLSALAKALSLEEERCQDRDELRRNERHYRRLYHKLRLLADNVPDCLWAKDLEGHYIFANQATCDKLLKCKRPEDALGLTAHQSSENEQALGYEHSISEIDLESDRVVARQKTAGRFLHNGQVRNRDLTLDVHKSPLWDENGEIIGTVGCGRDVTHEKSLENELREKERHYRDLYDQAPVMLFSVDSEDRLISVNNLWLETLGYRREQVLGKPVLDFMTPESRNRAVDLYLPELSKTGVMQAHQLQWLTRDGRPVDVLQRAIAGKDNRETYAGALVFIKEPAEHKTNGRDSELLAARLLQARKMETIATLAGGIAHQFNNALAVILGNLELIQLEGLRNEKLNRYVTPISQAGHKMVQLTSQLLVYARGGKFQTHVVPAHTIVTETLQLVSHSLGPHIHLETELSVDNAYIEADTAQMQMLLTAVLTNAAEAIEERGTVRISLSKTERLQEDEEKYPGLKKGHYVLLQITDDGKGMDEQSLNRIFEPFFTTKFQGRGLGMAAVYGIVKKHDGYIYVFSELGRGTTAQIFLPPVKPVLESGAALPAEAAVDTGTALIVEDEEMVLEIHANILERLGFKVLSAKTGAEAVDIARNHKGPIDFALLDIVLPDMNGTQIYPLLMQSRPDLKVIVCSGFAIDGPATEILQAGAQSFIQKPFTMSALSAVLQEVTGIRPRRR